MSAKQPDLFTEAEEQPVEKPAEETVEEPRQPVKEEKFFIGMPPLEGGRYDVALQDAKDKTLFRDFHRTDKKGEAEAIAEAKAKDEGRDTMVWDRKDCWVVHRVVVPPKVEEPKVEKVASDKPAKKKGIIRK